MRSSLDRALLSLAIASVLACIVAAAARFAPQGFDEYEVGDRLPVIPGLDFSQWQLSLLAWIDTRCHACIESAPALRVVASTGIPLIIIGDQPPQALDAFRERHAIRPSHIVSADRGELHFKAVPRLALVDRNRAIVALWLGSITELEAQQIADVIQTHARSGASASR
jgi:hypothetical protein